MMVRYLEMLDCSTGNVRSLRIDPKLETRSLSSTSASSSTNPPSSGRQTVWPQCGHVNAFQSGNGSGNVDESDEGKGRRGGEAYLSTDLTEEASVREASYEANVARGHAWQRAERRSESESSGSGSGADHDGAARDTAEGDAEAEEEEESSYGQHVLSREETVWPVFLSWIVDGTMRTDVGTRRIWTRADECDRQALRDLDAKTKAEEAEEDSEEDGDYDEEEEEAQAEEQQEPQARAEGSDDRIEERHESVERFKARL